MIDDRVHGVDAQRVEMELIDPHQGVVDEEPAHVVTVRPVEIERTSPRGLVAVCKVRPKFAEIIPLAAEMAVDDIEEHRPSAFIARIDHSLAYARPAA